MEVETERHPNSSYIQDTKDLLDGTYFQLPVREAGFKLLKNK